MYKKWKRQVMIGALALTMATGNAAPAIASPASDGQTDASVMAEQMGTSGLWNNWKKTWNSVKSDWTQISLTPGSSASELNFAWYTPKKTNSENSNTAVEAQVEKAAPELADSDIPKLIIGEGRNMKHAKVYEAVQTDVENEKDEENLTYDSNKVTVTGLKENTTYYYSYDNGDGYTDPESYTTKSTDDFSFIFVGDPQIGSSNELKGQDTEEFYNAQSDAVRNDSFNWAVTLNSAMEKTGDQASFVVSAGDQIQTTKKKAPNQNAANSEIEYSGYLSPEILKSLPVATTVGNHDADNQNYTYHFNTPNNDTLGDNGVVGGDYYFTYGDALFMMLNTQDTNVAEHKQFIEKAIAANKDCKWRIVTLHQDIYGSAEHSNEPEITTLRYQLTPYFEENDIDAVLTGHDHAYSRSKMLLGGTQSEEAKAYTDDEFDAQLEKDIDYSGSGTLQTAPGNIKDDTTDPDEQKYLSYLNSVMDADAVEAGTEGNTVVNPKGILYMTASSSSGSKYYDLVSRKQTYIANRWQEDVPTYSVIDVSDDTLTINTYRTDTDEKIDDAFSIVKKENAEKTSISKATVSSIKTQVYTGKKLTPSVTVKVNGKTLKKNTDYTVSYSNNVNTGKAIVTITGKGNYTGTKKISFYIAPKKVSASAKSTAKNKIKVMVKKASGKVSGYQIRYASDSKFKNAKTKSTAKTTYTLSSLKSKKTYYVKVRAYKNVSGKTIYGAYSKTMKVKVK